MAGRVGLTIGFKSYSATRHFMLIMNGVLDSLYRDLDKAIWDQVGSHQDQTSWKDPDIWIIDRLRGDERILARCLWNESGHEINPRYLRPHKRFTNRNKLLVCNSRGLLEVTERGRRFLNEPEGQVVAEIDRQKGVLTILQLVSELGPAKLGDIRGEFAGYCEAFTTTSGASSIQRALSSRLKNLMDRGYVTRRSRKYEITDQGGQWIKRCATYAYHVL
jgi:restriction system protein